MIHTKLPRDEGTVREFVQQPVRILARTNSAEVVVRVPQRPPGFCGLGDIEAAQMPLTPTRWVSVPWALPPAPPEAAPARLTRTAPIYARLPLKKTAKHRNSGGLRVPSQDEDLKGQVCH
jgi:hypothetical protein